jgi:AcrR family transcriptional regulator
VPRAGLTSADVVAAGAALADEAGMSAVTLASLAQRLGVKPPALYKHVDGLDDLRHRIAALAMSELAEAFRDELQGKSTTEALTAMLTAMRGYIAAHPGRYAATTGARLGGPGDPLLAASAKVIDSIGAVLSGYGIAPGQADHAIRALRCFIHGFALLEAAGGFQWSNDPDESFAWMINFIDAGLRAVGGQRE